MFTSESDVFQRCLSPQQAPQRCRGSTGASHLLRDLAATADLPPHSALFSQQLLDLTHRWWSEAEDPDIDVNDVYLLAAAACTCINCTPQGTLIRLHFSFQIRGSQPAPSPTFSRLSLLFSTAASFTTFRCCIRTVHEVVTEEYRVLELVNNQFGTYTPGDWVKLFEVSFF